MKKTAEEIREFVLKCVNNSEAIMREINRDYKDGKLNGEEHDLCMSRANRVLDSYKNVLRFIDSEDE